MSDDSEPELDFIPMDRDKDRGRDKCNAYALLDHFHKRYIPTDSPILNCDRGGLSSLVHLLPGKVLFLVPGRTHAPRASEHTFATYRHFMYIARQKYPTHRCYLYSPHLDLRALCNMGFTWVEALPEPAEFAAYGIQVPVYIPENAGVALRMLSIPWFQQAGRVYMRPHIHERVYGFLPAERLDLLAHVLAPEPSLKAGQEPETYCDVTVEPYRVLTNPYAFAENRVRKLYSDAMLHWFHLPSTHIPVSGDASRRLPLRVSGMEVQQCVRCSKIYVRKCMAEGTSMCIYCCPSGASRQQRVTALGTIKADMTVRGVMDAIFGQRKGQWSVSWFRKGRVQIRYGDKPPIFLHLTSKMEPGPFKLYVNDHCGAGILEAKALGMDSRNRTAYGLLQQGKLDEFMKYVFTGDKGETLSYAEMREKFG